MECLIAFLLVFVGMVALGGVGAMSRLQSGRSDRALKTLAQRYAGTFISGGWFRAPTVQFRYGSDRVPVVVYCAKHAKSGYTHVVMDWPDAAFRCEVLSRWAYLPEQSEFHGLDEVNVAADFNRHYVVLTNDPMAARALLVQPVRLVIQRLRAIFRDDFVHVSFRRGEMEVVKQRSVQSFEVIDDLVRSAGDLFDQCMLTRSVGIEFMHGAETQIVMEAICQVCGDEVVTDMVFCRRCQTPHHMECWHYVGACAIYGCQEKRFIAPQVAEPASSSIEDLPADSDSPPDLASHADEGSPG